MANESDKLVKGLGAGDMQLVGDFRLVDEDGNDLFKVDGSTGDVTASGTIGGGGGTPGGANTQVQFNDSGAFGGDAGLTYNKTTDTLTGVNATLSGTLDTTAGSISAATVTGTTLKNTGMTDGSILFAGSSDGTLTQDNSNLFFNDSTNQLGLGTNSTSATLDLVGTFQYTDGNQGASKVLTSDASGNATWQTPASSGIDGSGVAGNYAIFSDSDTVGNGSLTESASGEITLFGPGTAKLILNDGAPSGQVYASGGNLNLDSTGSVLINTATADCSGNLDAATFSVGGVAGASGGPFTTITSITVVNGIVTAISGT